MSEPLSSVEIEDVLSSIRKLVSEDLRESQPRPHAVERAEEAAAPMPAAMEDDDAPLVMRSKLILTPALRVVEDASPAAPGFSSVRQVMAVVGSAVDSRANEWEPEAGDPERGAELAAPPRWSPVEEEPLAWAGDAPEGEVIAMSAPDAADVPGWAQEQPVEERAEPEAPAPAANIEPDPAWADAAEEAVIAELEQEAPAALPEEDGMAYEEQVLRDLVRDIIRDELQGDLGERITRNIRKLVRAEIARAIAAESLLN